MNQFLIILKHELGTYFKNRLFIIITVIFVLGTSGFLFIPRIAESFKADQSEESIRRENQILVKIISSDTDSNYHNTNQNHQQKELPSRIDALRTAISASFPQHNVKFTNDSLEDIKKSLREQQAKITFVLDTDLKSYIYLTNTTTVYDANPNIMNEALKNFHSNIFLHQHGLTAEQIDEMQNINITHKVEAIDKDGSKNFWYAYVMMFVLYMVVIIFGQKVTMSVVTEKTSRAMEVLITSAKPISLMFGKILASCLAGLFQIIIVFSSAYLAYNFNKNYFVDNVFVNSLFNFPISLFGFMLIFFLLGYLIYSFLYGAFGSTVSKVEDVSSATMIPQFVFILSFIISINSMSYGDVNSLLMRILSIVPFSSPMAMFARIAVTEVPIVEIIASIILLIITTGIIGILAAKIYRVGVLMYGTRPNIRQIIKAIHES